MDETGQNFEEDPAAAFLARERDQLAGIDDDTLIISVPGDTTVAPPTGEGIPQEGEDLFGFTQSEEPPVSSDPYSAVIRMDETPDCILKWREQQEQMLSEKDQAEAIALQELRDIARREIEEWYSHHEDTLKHTKDSNRQAEEAFVEERDEDIPGHEWERVARICDFNPKSNKNTKDVSRMRSIFLQLKQSPPVH